MRAGSTVAALRITLTPVIAIPRTITAPITNNMVASIHVRSLRPVGGLLMLSGLSYDSDAGRQIAGSLTAIMSGVSYATSVGHPLPARYPVMVCVASGPCGPVEAALLLPAAITWNRRRRSGAVTGSTGRVASAN